MANPSHRIAQAFSAPCLTYGSFSFLTPEFLVFPNMTTCALDVVPLRHFRSPAAAAPPPSSGTSANRREPTPLNEDGTPTERDLALPRLYIAFSLGLPSLAPGVQIVYMSCRAEPNPMGALKPQSSLSHAEQNFERCKTSSNPSDSFAPDPNGAILVCNMTVQGGAVGWEALAFVVSRPTLLNYCQVFRRLISRKVTPMTPMETGPNRDIEMTPESPEAAASILALPQLRADDEDSDEPPALLDDSDEELEPPPAIGGILLDISDLDDAAFNEIPPLLLGSNSGEDLGPYLTPEQQIMNEILMGPMPWSAWGVRAAHWFRFDARWITTNHGARCVQISDGPHQPFRVLDFNPVRLRSIRRTLDRLQAQDPARWADDDSGSWLGEPQLPFVSDGLDHEPIAFLLDKDDVPISRHFGTLQPGERRVVFYAPELLSQAFAQGSVASGFPYVEVASNELLSGEDVLMEANCIIGLEVIPALYRHCFV
jgi:hypothetical protein